MRIDLSEHAKEQIRIRKIDLTELVDCLSAPDDLLYDVKEKTFIAVKRLNGKLLVVIYSAERQIKVVTAFRTDKLNIVENRIAKGRWVRI